MELTLGIIDDLRVNPCLWAHGSSCYKDRQQKRLALQTIGRKYAMTEAVLEKRIHNLKTQFLREHKYVQSMAKGKVAPKRVWFGYNRLLFLLNARDYNMGRERVAGVVRPSPTADESNEIETVNIVLTKAIKFEPEDEVVEFNQDEDDYDGTTIADPVDINEDGTAEDVTGTLNQPHKGCSWPTVKPDMSKYATNSTAVARNIRKRPHTERGRPATGLANRNVPTITRRNAPPEERITNRDEFSVYGEYVAYKMRNSGKSRIEIAIAQREMDDIFVNLESGMYGKKAFRRENASERQAGGSLRSALPADSTDSDE